MRIAKTTWVGKMDIGKPGVGEMGQILGETGVAKNVLNEMVIFRPFGL